MIRRRSESVHNGALNFKAESYALSSGKKVFKEGRWSRAACVEHETLSVQPHSRLFCVISICSSERRESTVGDSPAQKGPWGRATCGASASCSSKTDEPFLSLKRFFLITYNLTFWSIRNHL